MAESPDVGFRDSTESKSQNKDVCSPLNLPIENNDYNRKITIDDIPDSVKVLDDIISEYENSLQPVINNTENQSEDDGYMSLSRKNMYQKNGEDCIAESVPDSQSSDHKGILSKSPPVLDIIQSTLPKIKTSVKCTTYSSLPCCGLRLASIESKTRMGSCNSERGVLGIDISAVHKAVLRGELSKMPEPILNEHPVTIYPGKSSPPLDSSRGNRPLRLISSVEKHKEICHILNPTAISCSPSSSSSGSVDLSSINLPSLNKKDNGTTCDLKSNKNVILTESIAKVSYPSSTGNQVPKKVNGIAWEIYFDNGKEKAKGKLSSNTIREVTSASLSEEEYAEKIPVGSGLQVLKIQKCHKLNMCGNGTFIIRRSGKKLPKTPDVFNEYYKRNDSENENINNNERNEHMQPNVVEKNCNEYYNNSDCKINDKSQENAAADIQLFYKQRMSLELQREKLLIPKNSSINNESILLRQSMDNVEVSPKKRTYSYNEIQIEKNIESEPIGTIEPTCSYNDSVFKNSKNQDYLGELRSSSATTPHTDLAPTLEEDEEQLSDLSCGHGPLIQIENNISALLRGDIAVARYANGGLDEYLDNHHYQKRILEFRPGVHKSESAKEMLLSHTVFGPLPPSPPSSNPDIFEYDDLHPLPPLPPSPKELLLPKESSKSYLKTTAVEVHAAFSGEKHRPRRDNFSVTRHKSDELPLPLQFPFDNVPPAVPPHRGFIGNNTKSLSIDSNYKRKSSKIIGYVSSGITTPTGINPLPCEGTYSSRRIINHGTKRSSKQSPREEHRLQTSCSLPETPIFARGCDVPRTPYRRQNDCNLSGSRTAPRSCTSNTINMGASIVGISAGSAYGTSMCRQRSINHALASNELLRMSGVPARGWYPKQRSTRPLSTENIDRVTSIRMWDSSNGMTGSGSSRKPLTLPPNLTPSFLNKSPREALRRVASLLITKKKNSNERKQKNSKIDTLLDAHNYEELENNIIRDDEQKRLNIHPQPKSQKKRGIFKTLWKKTKHFSLDQ